MNKNNYLKIILTVIAVNLTLITFASLGLIPSANAGNGNELNSSKQQYGVVPINKDGSITVKFSPEEVVDVRLRGIDEASSLRWEAIKVKVQE
ncbi:MAG: hypothetical protein V4546_09020 [Bacteroidota bacterium]